MRVLVLALLAAFTVAFVPALVRAEEPPAKPPATEEKQPDEAKPAEEPAGEAEKPAPVLDAPAKAYQALRRLPRTLPYAERTAQMKKNAADYLEKWKAEGKEAKGPDLYYLGMIQQMAEQWAAAVAGLQAAREHVSVPANLRSAAASQEARLYTNAAAREAVGKEQVGASLEGLLAYAAKMTAESDAPMRGGIETTVASALEAMDRKQEAHGLRLAIAQRDPMMVARVYRALAWGLLGKTHALDGYAKVVKDAEPVLALLKTQQGKAVDLAQAKLDTAVETLKEKDPKALDEDGKLVNTDRSTHTPLERVVWNAQRQVASAKSYVTRIERMDKPFAMLGQPVPEWTLEHAFGETKALADLRGKVVVMDFWATWCPWCIRSVPAIRDLLEEYREKGLVFVGVTASASNVYSARYDLDDDLEHKAEPGQRVQPTARLARANQEPDGETVFAPEAYKAREIEVIQAFIENHQMDWPVVMIDKAEPAPKYALGGWPHAVVVDRAGRVRYFKSGALLLDRKEAFAKFKQVLADLLAEKAP